MDAKDIEQDEMIRQNAERISRNEEAIQRQTLALESIRDHYYPPPAKLWKRALGFILKVICVVLAYSGGVQAVDWYLNVRKSAELAANCAAVAHRLFFEGGDAAAAVRFYDKAVELSGGNVSYRLECAFVKNMSAMSRLFGVGRPLAASEREMVNEALAEATFLIDSEPDDPMPYVLAAQALTCRGENDEAMASVDNAVKLAPESAQVRVSACAIHFTNGDAVGARAALAEAERLDPSHPLAYFWKGMFALTVDRDPAVARAEFEKMTGGYPRLALGHAMLGRALLAEGSVDAARGAFSRAMVLDAELTMAILGMAESYEREKNPVLAGLWFGRALSQDENCMQALIGRARISMSVGAAEKAVDDLTTAIGLAPLRADLYRLRAEAYERCGNQAAADDDRSIAIAVERAAGASPR